MRQPYICFNNDVVRHARVSDRNECITKRRRSDFEVTDMNLVSVRQNSKNKNSNSRALARKIFQRLVKCSFVRNSRSLLVKGKK